MANYNNLKSAIQSVIKANGNNEITGPILQAELLSMINTLGAGYQYMGVAQPSTNPGTPDARVMYLAYIAGTYVNFGGIIVTGFCVLKYDTVWTKEDIPISSGGMDFVTEPDDLTIDDSTGENVLKFANRFYASSNPNGLGYIIIRENDTLASQMIYENTIYEIRHNWDLDGETLNIPTNCVLFFNGGTLSNGNLVGNQTKIIAANYNIFAPGVTKYRAYTLNGYKYVSKNTGGIIISGTWANDYVGSNWTGISENNLCNSDAINNYIKLHKTRGKIVFPGGLVLYVYEMINVQNRDVDFNNCTFKLPDYSTIEDATIPIPDGGVARTLRHPGVILACGGQNQKVKNLTIDEDATTRGEEPETLGSEFSVSYIANSEFNVIENFTIKNAVCCGIQETKFCHDNTLKNVEFNMIGEHAIYTLSYVGVSNFIGCKFINVGQSAWVFAQRGASACIRNSITAPEFAERTLKVYCENCLFKVDATRNVMTTYYGATVMEFVSCTWEGALMYGYSGYGAGSNPAMDRVEKRIFRGCTNPAGLYSSINSYGVVRELYNCVDVIKPFVDTNIIDGCKCPLRRSDDYNNVVTGYESDYKSPILVRNSDFYTDGDSGTAGYYIMKNTIRSVFFENCLIDIQKSGNPALMVLQGDSSQMDVVFIGCKINTPYSTLIRTTSGIQCKSLQITSCVINGIYSWLNDADTALFLFRGNTTIAYSYEKLIRTASAWVVEGNYSNYEGRNNYHRVTYVSLKDGDTYNLAGVFNAVGIPASVDLLKYVNVTPQGGATELFTYSIANNTPNASVLTLNGPTNPRTYKIEIDLTRYPI